MRTGHSAWLVALLGCLAPPGLAGCGDDDLPPDRPELSECERFDTCEEIGPFGDGDYEEWGGDGEQGGEEQEQGEPPE